MRADKTCTLYGVRTQNSAVTMLLFEGFNSYLLKPITSMLNLFLNIENVYRIVITFVKGRKVQKLEFGCRKVVKAFPFGFCQYCLVFGSSGLWIHHND